MSAWSDIMRARVRLMAAEHAEHAAADFAARNRLQTGANVVRLPHDRAVEEFGDGERPARPWVANALQEFARG